MRSGPAGGVLRIEHHPARGLDPGVDPTGVGGGGTTVVRAVERAPRLHAGGPAEGNQEKPEQNAQHAQKQQDYHDEFEDVKHRDHCTPAV